MGPSWHGPSWQRFCGLMEAFVLDIKQRYIRWAFTGRRALNGRKLPVLFTGTNISLIFLKPTNVLQTSIERYFCKASAHFLLHQNQKKWMRNHSLKIKFIYSLIPGLELRRSPIQVLTKPSPA